MLKRRMPILLVIAIFALIGLGVFSNIMEQRAIDRSKLPSKVEEGRGFQRWITNLKNKDIDVSADDFRLLEENEIYNTKWLKVTSMDVPGEKEAFEKTLAESQNVPKIVFSPSEREFIDYRNEVRGISPNGEPFAANEVRFYGQKEDKIIDARILDCSVRANCYFDRAYFLSNDLFVISEFSRNIDKKDQTTPLCLMNETCTYTVKIHLIDLINNSRLVYESKPLQLNLAEVLHEL